MEKQCLTGFSAADRVFHKFKTPLQDSYNSWLDRLPCRWASRRFGNAKAGSSACRGACSFCRDEATASRGIKYNGTVCENLM